MCLLLAQASAAPAAEEVSPQPLWPAPSTWEKVAEIPLMAALQRANDVRWGENGDILLSVSKTGVVRFHLNTPEKLLVETDDGNGEHQIWSTGRVAATPDSLVVASGLFSMGWKSRDAVALEVKSAYFAALEDLDAHGSRYAVLGNRRGKDGKMSPDGVIAWVGEMGPTFSIPRAIVRSVAGPGAEYADKCATFEVGSLRFLDDGSLFVIPGTEPGAYRFDRSGRLVASWDTEKLGFGVDCNLTTEDRDLYSRDGYARWKYLANFRMPEETLAFGSTPKLVVRRVEEEGVRWDLVSMEPFGRMSSDALPIRSGSPFVHARGDFDGRRVIFLLYDQSSFLPADYPGRRIAEPSRLIVYDTTPTPGRPDNESTGAP